MSGHNKWSKIKNKKGEADAKLNCTPKVGQKKSNFWGVFV